MSELQLTRALLLGAAVSTLGFSVAAQDRPPSPFDNPKNLQALPADITPGELRETMRGFSFATGLRCDDCHAKNGPEPGSGMNFPSDENREKRVARQMIRMVAETNARIDMMADLDRAEGGGISVQCMTCHRGVNKPEQIRTILEGFREHGDAEGAVARYQALREEYYGQGAYDFSSFTLGQYAVDVSEGGDPEFALPLQRLNVSLHPDDHTAHRSMGITLIALGKVDEAIAAYERALEIQPDNNFTRRLHERALELRGD